jgi:hypothetical protein
VKCYRNQNMNPTRILSSFVRKMIIISLIEAVDDLLFMT